MTGKNFSSSFGSLKVSFATGVAWGVCHSFGRIIVFTVNTSIADNLHDRATIAAAIRGYLIHPVAMMFMVLAPFLKLLRYMPLEFAVMGIVGDTLFYALRMVAYVVLSMRFMPVVVPWLLVRNVPFYWATFLFWLALLTVNYGLFHAIIPSGNSFWVETERFVRIVIFSLFAHVVIMLSVQQSVVSAIGRVPQLVPFFWPVTRSLQLRPHAGLISGELTGQVRALKAQNQYVLVMTDQGSHLVRMTLRNAIDCLPPDSGVQIHRSWWVSQAELLQSHYDPEAAVFRAGQDRTYPVGKTYAAEQAFRNGLQKA